VEGEQVFPRSGEMDYWYSIQTGAEETREKSVKGSLIEVGKSFLPGFMKERLWPLLYPFPSSFW